MYQPLSLYVLLSWVPRLPLHSFCAFLFIILIYNFGIANHFPSRQQGVEMSHLLCFCPETWSPAHSLVLKPEEKHNRHTDRKKKDQTVWQSVVKWLRDTRRDRGGWGAGHQETDHGSASSGVWSPAADRSAWPGAPASGRRYLCPHWPPAAPASLHPWLDLPTTCAKVPVAGSWMTKEKGAF